MQIGIMVEVPSTAFSVDRFAPLVDFFSIGTNDLAQYFLAADRENTRVSYLYSYLNPLFIGLLKNIVDDAHEHGKGVGICGEMAADLRALPLLAGLGFDEISCSAPAIAEIKSSLAQVDSGACRKLVSSAIQCVSSEEVSRLLADTPLRSREPPLLDSELIITQAQSRTVTEVIKEVCDTLYIAGRTTHPGMLEEEVWRREEVYSTDMGYGIAIPHCKTDHITANSIVVLKPAVPIQWSNHDNKPVTVVILLAVRESDAHNSHMKIFSKLARKIMHEDFRDFLIKENDADAVRAFLGKELEIKFTKSLY